MILPLFVRLPHADEGGPVATTMASITSVSRLEVDSNGPALWCSRRRRRRRRPRANLAANESSSSTENPNDCFFFFPSKNFHDLGQRSAGSEKKHIPMARKSSFRGARASFWPVCIIFTQAGNKIKLSRIACCAQKYSCLQLVDRLAGASFFLLS